MNEIDLKRLLDEQPDNESKIKVLQRAAIYLGLQFGSIPSRLWAERMDELLKLVEDIK